MGEPRSLVCRGLCTPPSPGALHTVTAGCTGPALALGWLPWRVLAFPPLRWARGMLGPRAEGSAVRVEGSVLLLPSAWGRFSSSRPYLRGKDPLASRSVFTGGRTLKTAAGSGVRSSRPFLGLLLRLSLAFLSFRLCPGRGERGIVCSVFAGSST